MTEFHETNMGIDFFHGAVPAILDALQAIAIESKRLNDNLERMFPTTTKPEPRTAEEDGS